MPTFDCEGKKENWNREETCAELSNWASLSLEILHRRNSIIVRDWISPTGANETDVPWQRDWPYGAIRLSRMQTTINVSMPVDASFWQMIKQTPRPPRRDMTREIRSFVVTFHLLPKMRQVPKMLHFINFRLQIIIIILLDLIYFIAIIFELKSKHLFFFN